MVKRQRPKRLANVGDGGKLTWLASRVVEMNLISLKNGSFEANLFKELSLYCILYLHYRVSR